MKTLIDGHNALYRLDVSASDHEGNRRELVRLVRAVDPGAVVFFDARHAPPGLPQVVHEDGAVVRYCRTGEADDAILARIRNTSHPAQLTVVTDDQDLRRRAEQLGARWASVRDFFAKLEPAAPDPDSKPVKGLRPMTAGDFGLPDEVDLDDPPDELFRGR